jgi:hypothetical protein
MPNDSASTSRARKGRRGLGDGLLFVLHSVAVLGAAAAASAPGGRHAGECGGQDAERCERYEHASLFHDSSMKPAPKRRLLGTGCRLRAAMRYTLDGCGVGFLGKRRGVAPAAGRGLGRQLDRKRWLRRVVRSVSASRHGPGHFFPGALCTWMASLSNDQTWLPTSSIRSWSCVTSSTVPRTSAARRSAR